MGVATRHDQRRRGQLLTAGGAIAWSTAGLFQRGIDATAPTQAAGRALVAGVALLLFASLTMRRRPLAMLRSLGRPGWGIAVFYAIASGSFLFSLSLTSVAHVMLIQSATPLIAALLARFLLGEAIFPRTWAAMACAVVGIGIMVGGSFDGGSVLGDALSIVNAFSFACVIVVARRARPGTTPLAGCFAQFLVVAALAPFATVSGLGAADAFGLVSVGLIQMFLGITLFTAGARLIPAAQASLLTLLEVILAPFWVWLAFGETPGAATVVGGAILLGALVVHVLLDVRAERDVLRAERAAAG